MRPAELIVQFLKNEGVRYIFGVTGSGFLEVLDRIGVSGPLQFISCQHEQGAIFMADGWSRVSGEVGVCMVTVGPAATNLVTGTAQALAESSPVVIIVPEQTAEHATKGVSSWHGVDQTAVFRPVTKFARRVEGLAQLRETLEAAFRAATTGRPGPAYVGIPRNYIGVFKEVEWKSQLDGVTLNSPRHYRVAGRSQGDPALVREAAAQLRRARRGVLLAGGGVHRSWGGEAALKLAQLLAFPVVATGTHKGVVPEDHELAVGNSSVFGTQGSPAHHLLSEADVILAIGCTFSEMTTLQFGHTVIPPQARIVQIDVEPSEIAKNYPVEVGIIGDAKVVMGQLLEEVTRLEGGEDRAELGSMRQARRQQVRSLKEAWKAWVAKSTTQATFPLQRGFVLQELRACLPREAVVTVDGGANYGWVNFAFEATSPMYFTGDYAAMGSGYPIAMAAALARPEVPAVAICGDGSFLMCLQEIGTAVKYRIPAVAVVMHNGTFGNIKYSQWRHFEGRYVGTDLPQVDYARVAEAFGAVGLRVERPEEIRPAMEQVLKCGRPAVLDVIIADDPELLVPPTW